MDICREVVPPEVVYPDGVRVACHLHVAGRDGAVGVSSAEVVGRPPPASNGPVLPVIQP